MKTDTQTATNSELLAALRRVVPWMGKLIAEGVHDNSVCPNDAIGALAQAEAAIANCESAASLDSLTERQRYAFASNLHGIVCNERDWPQKLVPMIPIYQAFEVINATSAQRAEALRLTLEPMLQWNDSPKSP